MITQEAWDSYVQGTAMDASNPMWPMGLPDLMNDANGLPQQPQQQQSPQSSQPQQQPPINSTFMGSGSVFMGNGTPERNTMM